MNNTETTTTVAPEADEVAMKRTAKRAAARQRRINEKAAAAVEAVAAKAPAAPEEAPAAKARAPRPASERRNETTHPDGASAVATLACPTCAARKAVRCVRHDGEHTNHVHAARMKAWEAKGSPAATLPAKAAKAPAKKAAAK